MGTACHKSVFSHFQGKQMLLPPGNRPHEKNCQEPGRAAQAVILYGFQVHFPC